MTKTRKPQNNRRLMLMYNRKNDMIKKRYPEGTRICPDSMENVA